MIEKVHTEKAPGAIGPYSQGIKAGNLLFVSGQIATDPATGAFNSDIPALQAEQCIRNIEAIAQQAGTDLSRTVKTTVLLTDLAQFAEVNKAYAQFFTEPFPTRACYQVSALPRGAQVEIEAVISLE